MMAMTHLIAAPILLPLLTAAVMLMLGEKHRPLKAKINLFSSLVGLFISVMLLQWTQTTGVPGSIGVYLPGNWQAPFGIVLVVDRLSALMLVLTGIIGVSALLFAMARWDGAGSSFHALFQIQLMGLYGAFLTADLFNLFVFFEVLLAASYGLLLHGSGRARVSSGLHYISINLLASSLFLIGAALIYGVTGTLNMADLALKIPLVPEADRGLLHAGAGILAVAFLAKAGMWPLNFWLVPAYSSASAPVAAMFAIMTKVGVYTLLRLWTLLFSGQAGASAFFGGDWLIYGGMATIACAALAIIAAQRLERMASLSILVSAGILLSAIGFAQPNLIGAALFYLVSSTLALSALFLLAELIERSRSANEIPLEDESELLPRPQESLQPPKGINLDDEQKAVVGQVIPWTMAFLGLSFIACALLIIGMPPLSGFIGKLSLIGALLNPLGLGSGAPISNAAWALLALLILSGLASLMAFSRLGIQRFWTPEERPSPLLRKLECAPIFLLLGLSIALTFKAEPLLRYTQATADALNNPQQYVMAVLGTRAVPSPEARTALQEVQP
ncbi:multisubunit potassium/proton antiporter PhaD subunit [Pseudomonas baetica]|uniref:Multisubunit potassium/proton antiporter PhaD subunit n=1 Tax=Pseudomonas baetica TaxID=674054 RepID=A0ABX4PUH8_9PSED|nr:monovalent cation/H+ antiporter subunit D [Pseudomonas baetica]PKA68675.1 multisubunit potassium/proton antiporter PhaD subunit [Pseudomonas baetica]PTC19230.1 monovalent cation/H+ antiporter subunit D [Pseudomonas baetica]